MRMPYGAARVGAGASIVIGTTFPFVREPVVGSLKSARASYDLHRVTTDLRKRLVTV
jgi:hypothetical protein